MDVPTGSPYTMAGGAARRNALRLVESQGSGTAGAAISPIFAGFLFSRPALIDIPFFIAGTLKIAYDAVLYREFGRCHGRGRLMAV
jgi:hypothetical protein